MTRYTLHIETAKGQPGKKIGATDDLRVAQFQANIQAKIRRCHVLIVEHGSAPANKKRGAK